VTNDHFSFAVSLPADFLVWIASPEAEFLKNGIVFAAWDVDELKGRKKEIVGGPPGTGELWLGYQGFPRFMGGQPLPVTQYGDRSLNEKSPAQAEGTVFAQRRQ
jgi:hypothetical protein